MTGTPTALLGTSPDFHPERLRADLHVHTCHSKIAGTMPFLGSRDCYSSPADVYRVAKARGMDLVAFTDHDSIDGALELLAARPGLRDVIVGEEVSCAWPGHDIAVHLGVYDMTESLHRDIQPLRRNVFEVAARLRDAAVFFSLNHLLHFYRRQIPFDRYLELLDAVPAVEVRNGTMLMAHNALVASMVERRRLTDSASRLAIVAGSDAHTLRRVGLTWTEAPGRTRDDFLTSLREGRGCPGGLHGTAATVAADAYGVIARYLASLIGYGPRDLPPVRRGACLAFAGATLPFQFMPLAIAIAGKARERREVAHATRHFAAVPAGQPSPARQVELRS
jgi:predicted metal-dependent phosphoesterase TrpH